ncbi:MAG: ABC transporter permease [Deltaproteobacteria bacterium]|nr:ABC transporter permease [Deltaproteobacteria bacterium]
MKRAYYSLWILGIVFLLSLVSEFIANDKPLYLRFQGKSYAPVLFFYSDQTFGGRYKTEADYLALKEDEQFIKEGFMIFPLIPHSPLHSYLDIDEAPPHPPSGTHWLGTDAVARDVLARLLYGFRICMVFALSLMAISAVLGVIIGGVQGYLGGKVDIVVQRLIEIWSSLPFLYVVILVGSIYGSSFILLLLIMVIFQWIGLSYYMRGEFFKLKNMTYVKAAKTLGTGPVRILFQQILPNALTPVITIMPFSLIAGITALTALDFLGFGLPPPMPSWGELLSQGLNNLYAPWIAVSTVAALFATLLLATFIGEGVREAFDPRAEYRIE